MTLQKGVEQRHREATIRHESAALASKDESLYNTVFVQHRWGLLAKHCNLFTGIEISNCVCRTWAATIQHLTRP